MTMSTLLIRLAGPMQSWGTQSRFTDRDTGREPSKSGVVGLLCAALGKPRREEGTQEWPTLAELAALRMGVRVDREGVLLSDYHTAGGAHRRGERYGVVTAEGKRGDPVTSRRHYLADADFLVGLEGERGLLTRLDRALAWPVWQIFLGRKSFVPGFPVRLPEGPPVGPGLREEALEEALASYPFVSLGERPERLRVVVDAPAGSTAELRWDVPVSYERREFAIRNVETRWVTTPPGV